MMKKKTIYDLNVQYFRPPKRYSEGADEEDRAQETPQDGEPLSRS